MHRCRKVSLNGFAGCCPTKNVQQRQRDVSRAPAEGQHEREDAKRKFSFTREINFGESLDPLPRRWVLLQSHVSPKKAPLPLG